MEQSTVGSLMEDIGFSRMGPITAKKNTFFWVTQQRGALRVGNLLGFDKIENLKLMPFHNLTNSKSQNFIKY